MWSSMNYSSPVLHLHIYSTYLTLCCAIIGSVCHPDHSECPCGKETQKATCGSDVAGWSHSTPWAWEVYVY